MNSDSKEWTADRWAEWVTTQVQRREKVYRTDPDELFSAYNREINYTRDYHGRELLELLQNADDAGVDFGQANRVSVVLMHEGLCVANSGQPFSEAGIKSLMVSDNSPKKNDRAHYIGNKGLGFRSILSWTSCPFILSGNLVLGFDSRRAEKWLEALCSQDSALQERVSTQIEKQGRQQLVPTLAVPSVLDACGRIEGMPSGAAGFEAVWNQAKQLTSDGYDTVIALPFTTQDAYSQAKEQLSDIGREFLLFTKHLASLTVQSPSGLRLWWVNRAADIVEIKSDDEQTQTWQVFEVKGDIPVQFLREDLKKTPGYEIKIAVSADDAATPPFLFNHFQTQARFPYPVVAHATFEMANNRQHVPVTKANEYLVQKLAELMAEVAEASYDTRYPWLSLSFISTSELVDPALDKMGFHKALIAAARNRNVIPVRNGQMVKPGEAKRLRSKASVWLPMSHFGDVIERTDNDALFSMMDALDVPILSEQKLRVRLDYASPTLQLNERAALIVGLTRSRLMPEKPAPSLLIDQNGLVIPADFQVFLPSEKMHDFPLPSWMSLRMLSNDLNLALRRQFGSGVRNLTGHLNAYRLTEYSLQALTQAAVAQANEHIRNEPEREQFYRHEAFQTIFEIYRASTADGETHRSSSTNVQVLTAANSFAPANTLYFSGEYPCGKLTQALYGSIGNSLLVASPDSLQIGEKTDAIESFLRWLGVADRPRAIEKNSDSGRNTQEYLPIDYQDFVRNRLKYPAKTSHAEEFVCPSDLYGATFSKVEAVDRLEQLIRSAAPDALLAWIALDERVENWRRQGDATARVGLKPPGKQQFRYIVQPIPSYVSWVLEQQAWLPTTNGNNQAPSRCIMASSLAEELKTILPRPTLAPNLPVFKELGVDQLSFRNALQRVGVRQSLEELSQDEIYQLLLDLPRLDPSGQCAKSLHRALMLRQDESVSTDSVIKTKFLQTGKLWGNLNDKFAYYPVSELYYVGTNIVPQVVARTVPRIEIDKNQGRQKVQRVFGVQTLDSSKWKIEVTTTSFCPNSDGFSDAINRLKPYAYAFRLHSDPNADGQRRLKNLEVRLCSYIEGTATVAKLKEPFVLVEKGDIMFDGDVVYLYTDSSSCDQPLHDVVLIDSVGEVLAEVLGVERSSDFARLVSAPSSQRTALLARVLGTDFDEAKRLLGQAQEKMDMRIEETTEIEYHSVYVPPPVVRPSNTMGVPPPVANGFATQQYGAFGTPSNSLPVGAVSIQPQQHIPTVAGRKVELRVQVTPLGTRSPSSDTRVTNAARCEEFAARFEEAQGRYSLAVSQLKGLRGYGCDVLSFTSLERIEQFVAQSDNPDTDLVERFIEVKGKSSENSLIELRGNELHSAERFGSRFYLYRIYEEMQGRFSILTLSNPLSASCNKVYEVNLSQQERTERFSATEPPKGLVA